MVSHGNKQSHASILLSADDNAQLFALLGPRCQSLSTAVVQIYKSEAPSHHRWNKRSCGVACFVKDNTKRSYFIRIYDMDRGMLVFDQEIYNQFRYKTPRVYFHTFEADDCQVGLNFADESEAVFFQQMVETKLTERRLRKEKRNASKRQQGGQTNGNNNANQQKPVMMGGGGSGGGGGGGNLNANLNKNSGHLINPSAPLMNGASAAGVLGVQPANIKVATTSVQASNKFKKKGEKKKLRKEDISLPTNFQHISHVGWDPNRGFDLENVDPKLKQFFSKAGVSERELQDKETRDFIYDFIDKHGGIEAAMLEVDRRDELARQQRQQQLEEMEQQQDSMAPPPAPPPRQSSMSRPPPPSKVQASPPKSIPEHAPPPPPPTNTLPGRRSVGAAPPPPGPPSMKAQAPPPPPPVAQPAPPPLPQANIPVPPPPPPPPPMPAVNVQPPAPRAQPKVSSLPPVSDVRGNLMEAIRKGPSLKHVSEEEKNLKVPGDARDDLLGQIRSGVTLKKVDLDSLSSGGGSDIGASSGIAGMLAKALQERSGALRFSDSEDEGGPDEDDDEWDD